MKNFVTRTVHFDIETETISTLYSVRNKNNSETLVP